MVEIFDLFCSDIDCDVLEFLESVFIIRVENVLFDKFFVVKEKVKEVFGNFVEGREVIDMDCFNVVIYWKILDIKNRFENCFYDMFVDVLVRDFFYFIKLEDFKERMEII